MPTQSRKSSFLCVAGGASLLCCALAASGESEQGASQETSLGSLQEIVVTATRREESISKVPISITALSQDALDQKGIRDFSEMVRFTPGVSIDTSGTNAIAIRGISSSGGAGTTGIYIDDTPIQMRALGFNPDDALPKAFDLDRVEVLRGPQGTLFGAGSEGGTVRYIMMQPSVTKESTYARTELSYTQFGEPSYEAGIAHGGPIIDGVLGYRASVWFREDGGWINRVDDTTGAITEKNANHAQTAALRLAFLYQPADNVKITPSIAYQSKQQHDISTYWPAYSNPGGGQFNDATPERIPSPDQYYLPALKIQVDFAHATLISNTSYYHRDEQDSYEGTLYDLAFYQALGWPNALYPGAPPLGCGSASTTAMQPCSWYPLLDSKGVHLPAGFAGYSTPNTMTNQQRSWTQELRLQSTDNDSKWRWTVGAFWSLSQELSIEQLNDPNIGNFLSALYGGPALDAIYGTGASTPNNIANNLFFNPQNTLFTGPYYNCVGAPGSTVQPAAYPIPNCDIYYNYNKSYDRQLAGFGEVNYKLTDQFSLTAGGRVARMGFSLQHYANGYENYGPSLRSGTQQQTAFTPKVGLNYQADDHNLYYFTYAKGFRPGGSNPPLPPLFCAPGLVQDGFANGQAPATYNSDTTQSYEVGSKNNFNDRLKIATSVYYIKWNGIQQNVYVPGNCGLQFTDNLGTAVAKGFDFQADASIGGGLSLEASVGYTSARFTQNSLAGLAIAGDAISGEAAINYSPGTNAPWTIAVGPQFDFRAAEHDAFVRLDWEYTSKNPWTAPVQDPASKQYDPFSYSLPATSFVSLRSGVKLGNWQVSAFIDNLFDSHTVLNYALVQNDSFNPAGVGAVRPQENDFTFRPRTFGITATFKE
jgi:iron complex outermembrane receptor protein